jgi:3-hydroxyacyl-CoA dehydrogenase
VPVALLETDAAALDKGVARIRDNYEASAKKGAHARQSGASMSLLKPTLRLRRHRDADLVIEAVFEDMAIKASVFATLDASRRPARSSRRTRRRST